MELGRKVRQAIRSGPVPLRRDTDGGRGLHRHRDPPWGVSGSSHILGGTPDLGFDARKMSPLRWLENQWE